MKQPAGIQTAYLFFAFARKGPADLPINARHIQLPESAYPLNKHTAVYKTAMITHESITIIFPDCQILFSSFQIFMPIKTAFKAVVWSDFLLSSFRLNAFKAFIWSDFYFPSFRLNALGAFV